MAKVQKLAIKDFHRIETNEVSVQDANNKGSLHFVKIPFKDVDESNLPRINEPDMLDICI